MVNYTAFNSSGAFRAEMPVIPMPSEDTFTKVSVDHEKQSVVAVTFDGDDGSIVRVEKVGYDGHEVKLPENKQEGTNYY